MLTELFSIGLLTRLSVVAAYRLPWRLSKLCWLKIDFFWVILCSFPLSRCRLDFTALFESVFEKTREIADLVRLFFPLLMVWMLWFAKLFWSPLRAAAFARFTLGINYSRIDSVYSMLFSLNRSLAYYSSLKPLICRILRLVKLLWSDEASTSLV